MRRQGPAVKSGLFSAYENHQKKQTHSVRHCHSRRPGFTGRLYHRPRSGGSQSLPRRAECRRAVDSRRFPSQLCRPYRACNILGGLPRASLADSLCPGLSYCALSGLGEAEPIPASSTPSPAMNGSATGAMPPCSPAAPARMSPCCIPSSTAPPRRSTTCSASSWATRSVNRIVLFCHVWWRFINATRFAPLGEIRVHPRLPPSCEPPPPPRLGVNPHLGHRNDWVCYHKFTGLDAKLTFRARKIA